jgi:hypothetical protein
MTVTSVVKDFDSLTLTLVVEFDAPVERVWQLWADPRQLERWWGPPSHPATVEEHDLTPGGEVTYFLTGPEGEKSRGWWRVSSVDRRSPWSPPTGSPTGAGHRSPTCRPPGSGCGSASTTVAPGWRCARSSTPGSRWSGWCAQGGWMVPFVDQDFGEIMEAWFARADEFLLRRTTYDMMYPYWSQVIVTDPEEAGVTGQQLNNLP